MVRGLEPGDPELIGPYRLRGLLGTGGMGRVFLGASPGGRLVAVKVIRADLAADAEFRMRFQREVAVARKVSSAFTAPVVDADLDGPVPWLATDYVAGPSLAGAVAECGPLPAASVLRLAAGLAAGLSAIHAAGVIHRDLKPANVLLAEDGPRVIDFGISLGTGASGLTRTGLVVGSPGFMSPEQAEGREVGPPSDIFSLGAVLAFAATGTGPFGGGSTPALVYRVVHSPASLGDVPAAVRPLIERCLAKDPGQRPTTADLLTWTGSGGPAADWLPEPVTRTLPGFPAAAAAADTVTSPSPVTDPGRRRGSRGRAARAGRSLAIASMVTGLLAASAAGGFALTAFARQSSAPPSRSAVHPYMGMHGGSTAQRSAMPSSAATIPATTPATTPAATAAAASTPAMTPAATSTPAPTPSASTTPAATPTPTPTPTSTVTPAASQSASPAAG